MMGIEDGELKEDDCTLAIVNGSHDGKDEAVLRQYRCMYA